MFPDRVYRWNRADPGLLWLYRCSCSDSLFRARGVHVDVNGGNPSVSEICQSSWNLHTQIYPEDRCSFLG